MTKLSAKLIALTKEVRYEPETGYLYWTKSGRGRNLSLPIGRYDKQGYLIFNYDKQTFRVHRVIWFIIYGSLPRVIDHKNEHKADNRLSNLRVANHSTNGANRGKQNNNTSGYKGVSFSKRDKTWFVQIKCKNIYYSKHGFNSPKEAARHYNKIAKSLFGDFAKTNFEV